MLNIKFAILASKVVRDSDSNKISIFELVEDLDAQGFPLFFPTLTFFAIFEREISDPNKYDISYEIKLNDDVMIKQKFELDFADKLRNRSIININGLVLKNEGVLSASLFEDSKQIANYSVVIKKVLETK